MTAALFRLYRAAGDTVARAAPGPDGGWFVAANTADGTSFVVGRVEATRTFAWRRKLEVGGSSLSPPVVASSPDRTRFAAAIVDVPFNPETYVVCIQADGTVLWSRSLALITYEAATSLVVGPSGDVYIAGHSYADEQVLMKLAASDGTTAWTARIDSVDSAGSGIVVTSLGVLPGGDIVVAFQDAYNLPTLANGLSRTHLQRLSASDGSITWTRWLSWPDSASSNASQAAVGIDGDDNIYVAGPPYVTGSVASLPLLKLDEDGATIWSRGVEHPASEVARDLSLGILPFAIAASSTGVLVPYTPQLDQSTPGPNQTVGFVFVPAAGTVGEGSASLVHLLLQRDASGSYTPVSAPGASAGIYSALDVDGGGEFTVVFTSSELGAYDQEFGPYERTTLAFDVVTGTATAASRAFTRDSAATITNSSKSVTDSADTLLLLEEYAGGLQLPNPAATTFGLPAIFNDVGYVTGWVTTTIGTPTGGARSDMSSVGTVTNFGTPALTLNRSFEMFGISPTLQFGIALSLRGEGSPFGQASGLASTTQFGQAVAALSTTLAASALEPATAFGAAFATFGLTATGLAAAPAFGTPSVGTRHVASGIRETSLGTPSVNAFGSAAGFARTVFGTPSAAARAVWTCSGFAPFAAGTPVVGMGMRARSGRFRIAFGSAEAERTAP